MEHGMGEVVSLEQEPPSDLAVDTRGLPTARAKLATYLAWRNREALALAALEAGRGKLAGRVDDAEAGLKRQAAEVDAAAASVVEQIRRGLEWTLGAARKRPDVEGPDLSVAKSALAKIDGEIAAKREAVAAIDARLPGLAHASLVEHAAKIGGEYRAALDAARDGMTALEGLNVVLGRGRQGRPVGEMPAYAVAGHPLDFTPVAAPLSEVAAAADVWRSLARAWLADPRADVSKMLRFAPHDPAALESVLYHELSAVERRLVDFRAASSHH
jgi:hypothetical protein